MGQSTDAILFYGYVWEEDIELPDSASMVYGKEHSVLAGRHCSDEYSMPFIYVQATRKIAWRGHVTPIEPEDLDPLSLGVAEHNNQLLAFVKEHDIDLSEAKGPGWFLVSWWG